MQAAADELQLRILTGLHAGARAPLDQAQHLLGSAEDCDFVLADPGVLAHHARLLSGPEGWQLHWLAEQDDAPPPAAPVELRPGVAVAVGPVIVALDMADAPWPTLEQLVLGRPMERMAYDPRPATLQVQPAAADAESDAVPRATEGAGATAATTPRNTRTRRPYVRAALVATASAAVLLSAFAYVAWPDQGALGTRQEVAAPPAPPAAQRARIETVIKELGFAQRASVEASGSKWVIRANYFDEAMGEKLYAGIARLQPRPILRMTSDQDLPQDVNEALVRAARDLPGPMRATYLGDARFKLEGRVPSAQERDRVLGELRGAFPFVRDWQDELLTPEEVSTRLMAELQAAGWDVSGQWQSGALAMTVRLAQAQVATWERALSIALTRNSVPMKARLDFERTAGGEQLPFTVRGVIDTDPPYVVTADGAKLAPQGRYRGWRLVAVDPDKVTFDNGSKRASIAR